MTDKKNSYIHTHKSHIGIAYSHSHDDVHKHEYGHSEGHGHSYSHQNTKMVLNRLSRASGHLEAVKRMVEDGKDCTEVLIQLSAVIAALKSTGKVILADRNTT